MANLTISTKSIWTFIIPPKYMNKILRKYKNTQNLHFIVYNREQTSIQIGSNNQTQMCEMLSKINYYSSLSVIPVSYNIVAMDVLVPRFTYCYRLTIFPLVHRRHASFLALPLSVNQKTVMTVRLLSNLYILLIHTVVVTLWILRVIDTCHTMRMSTRYQSVHSLFFEPIYSLKRGFLVKHSNGVSCLILHSISLEFEFFLGTTLKFHSATTYSSLILSLYISTVEETTQRDLLDRSYWRISYQWKDRSESYFRLIFILFSCFKKVISLG